MTRKSVANFLYVIAVISLIVGIWMLSKGHDKITDYRNSDYSSVNAYVGGDAYNYIINGTYSTTFCVVGMGCLLITLISFIEGSKLRIVVSEEENKISRNQLPGMD